ncbi:MAG: efflux RND transporter periplasmic adaptor subunit [Planctomycetota bacterium]
MRTNWPRSAAAWTVLVATSLLTACAEPPPPPQEPPPREVEVAQLTASDLPFAFEFVGRTASSQRVEIRARVNGFLDQIAYEEGAQVNEGDLLFQIDKKPFEAALRAATAELAQQQARLDNAEALLARIEPLAEENAVAQKELDDAQASVREAAAAVEAASAKVFESELDLGYTEIRSPLSGVTGEATEREGAYLGLSSPALTYVARLDPIWVEFSISEAQALRGERRVREGKVVYPEDRAFNVSIVLQDGTKFPAQGRISFADATVDERTGTFLVRAEIPNTEQTLHPGQYVRVLVEGAFQPDAIVAPQRAVQIGPKGAFVWVVDPQGKAERRPVSTGQWEGDGWVIEEGLQSGDRVIVNGALGLQPGTPLSIVAIATSGDGG